MSFPPIKIFNIHDVHVIVMVLMLLPPLLFSSTSPAAALNEFFPYERDALIQLRDIVNSSTAANLHGNWTGPPCYKNQSRWAGIGCSNSHVTRLVLEGLHLTASLPPMLLQNVTFLTKLSFRNNSLYGPLPNLSNLLDLEYLFLSHNQFSGSIPIAYAQLPKLTKLELQDNSLQGSIPPFDQDKLIAFNVSHNQLDGPIPETPTLERFPKSSYDYNSNLCGSPLQVPCPVSTPPPPPPFIPPPQPAENKKGSLKIWSIALIAAAAALVPLSIMLFFLCYYRRIHLRKQKSEQPAGEGFTDVTEKKAHWSESTDDPERRVELEFFDKSRPVFDLDDLLRASAEVIGKGKLGTTYKAMVECGPVVAVKRFKGMNDLRDKEFIQQLQLLGKLRHQNLVELISFYYSKDEKLIIYEYVSHGNLFQLLHGKKEKKNTYFRSMAFRGRGRGRGGFGGGGFRPAKQVPFELFPEIEELGTAAGVKENVSLAIWYNRFQKYWNSSPYYVEDQIGTSKKTQRKEIEKYSDRNSVKTSSKDPLSHFIRMEPDYVPAELAKGEKKEKHGVKRVRWNPESDMQKLDVFEKLEQKHQGQEVNEKKEDEEEEEDENFEEEEDEYSDDGDYNQNIDFDDDDDDFNMGDDNDDEPIF